MLESENGVEFGVNIVEKFKYVSHDNIYAVPLHNNSQYVLYSK